MKAAIKQLMNQKFFINGGIISTRWVLRTYARCLIIPLLSYNQIWAATRQKGEQTT